MSCVGRDLLSYRTRTTPVIATTDGAANDGAASEADNILGDIEDVFGGSANDVLTGSAADNVLVGGQVATGGTAEERRASRSALISRT
jgi:hypothetical protein